MVSGIRKLVPPDAEYSEMLLPPTVLTEEVMTVVPLLFHQTTTAFVGKLSNGMSRSLSESDLKMLCESQVRSFESKSQAIEANNKNCIFSQTRRDPAFVHFFACTLSRYKVIEFYVRDENGSFLLRDKLGVEHVLVVKYEEDLDRDEATLRKAGLSSKLCDKLKARELMVCSLKHRELPSIEYIDMMMPKPAVVDG